MVFIVEKTAYSPGRNNIVHTQIDVSYDPVCEPLDDHMAQSVLPNSGPQNSHAAMTCVSEDHLLTFLVVAGCC